MLGSRPRAGVIPGHGSGLTALRNDDQSPQVLSLDTKNSMDLLRLRYPGSEHIGHDGVYYRGQCEAYKWNGMDTDTGQGKWELRGKRRGDLLSEY